MVIWLKAIIIELLAEGLVDDALKTLNEFITGKKKIAAQPFALEKVMVN